MSSDPTNQFGSNPNGSQNGSRNNYPVPKQPTTIHHPHPLSGPGLAAPPQPPTPPAPNRLPPAPVQQPMPTASAMPAQVAQPATPPPAPKPAAEPNSKLANDLRKFDEVAARVRGELVPAQAFETRCQQAFDVANDLFGNAPTWVCFYRELLGGAGLVHTLFDNHADFGAFLRTEQYHQIQMMLTALRSRDLPENDPNDPQRMITVRLPKSLHEAMCEEAGRLNISVNRLCISRMLQLLDPKMIPETTSKPRGRKPRTRQKQSG
ncbi:MAG: hypothetical protein ACE361_03285 [Aureliella sp.]